MRPAIRDVLGKGYLYTRWYFLMTEVLGSFIKIVLIAVELNKATVIIMRLKKRRCS